MYNFCFLQPFVPDWWLHGGDGILPLHCLPPLKRHGDGEDTSGNGTWMHHQLIPPSLLQTPWEHTAGRESTPYHAWGQTGGEGGVLTAHVGGGTGCPVI